MRPPPTITRACPLLAIVPLAALSGPAARGQTAVAVSPAQEATIEAGIRDLSAQCRRTEGGRRAAHRLRGQFDRRAGLGWRHCGGRHR